MGDIAIFLFIESIERMVREEGKRQVEGSSGASISRGGVRREVVRGSNQRSM